jgi:hypothetical protein
LSKRILEIFEIFFKIYCFCYVYVFRETSHDMLFWQDEGLSTLMELLLLNKICWHQIKFFLIARMLSTNNLLSLSLFHYFSASFSLFFQIQRLKNWSCSLKLKFHKLKGLLKEKGKYEDQKKLSCMNLSLAMYFAYVFQFVPISF